MKRAFLLLTAACAAIPAFGQSFNIDFNATSGNGAGVPPLSFGGAAGQPGTWNNVSSSTPLTQTLVGLDSVATGVTLTRENNGQFLSRTGGAGTTEYRRLMDDILFVASNSPDTTLTLTVNGLAAGKYAIFTYGLDVQQPSAQSVIGVTGSTSDNPQLVGDGAPPASTFQFLRSHALHIVNVSAGGTLTVTVTADPFVGNGVIGGMQIKLLSPAPRLRFYVDDGAAGDRSGSGWADAMTSVQDALLAATDVGAADVEVWVANGFYRPTTGTSRSATFNIPPGLKMFGGFSGNETSLDQRTGLTLTYLTGEIGAAADTDNSYTVVTMNSPTSATELDGFFIVDGYNNAGGDGRGGGLKISGGAAVPTVRNCSFSRNWAAIAGAGLYSENVAPNIVDCTFFENNCYNGEGGGLAHSGAGLIDVWNCRFLGNSAIGYGGGAVFPFSDARLVNNIFSGNTGSAGGGAVASYGSISVVTYVNCTMANNFGGGSGINQVGGGGILLRSSAIANVRNCILWDNTDGHPSTTVEGENLAVQGGATANVAYSTIAGWSGALGGSGNNALNPQLVNALGNDGLAGNFDDNLRIAANSPAIDSGNNSLLVTDVADLDRDLNFFEQTPLDFDFNPRRSDVSSVADTGAGTAPIVDRGAFERIGGVRGDMNCDGAVNNFDIDPFVLALSNPAVYASVYPECNALNGDVNGDGALNNFDIDPFVGCVTNGGCP
jgi:hypothetical protein